MRQPSVVLQMLLMNDVTIAGRRIAMTRQAVKATCFSWNSSLMTIASGDATSSRKLKERKTKARDCHHVIEKSVACKCTTFRCNVISS